MAEYADRVGVTLGIECLNRFETYLLNTHADAVRFVRDVSHPRCRVMYDTFHANVEEKDVAEAIRSCGDLLVHVHISENDRSTPGAGSVRWDATFDALREIGYDGWLVVEAFGLALPEIAAATKIWRRMFQSEEQLARWRSTSCNVKSNGGGKSPFRNNFRGFLAPQRAAPNGRERQTRRFFLDHSECRCGLWITVVE